MSMVVSVCCSVSFISVGNGGTPETTGISPNNVSYGLPGLPGIPAAYNYANSFEIRQQEIDDYILIFFSFRFCR